MPDDRLYRFGSKFLVRLLRWRRLRQGLGSAARIINRYTAVLQHLETFAFDGVIDGGANIGEFAYLCQAALPQADLVCVEPHPECAQELRRAGFKTVASALWGTETEVVLSQVGASLTSCTVVGDDPGAPKWRVPTVRLDQLPVSGFRLLIKLDLQGAEPQALSGMGELWPRVGGVLLEVSLGRDGTYPTLSALLSRQGFEEYSTVNEFVRRGRVVEADKLWIRSDLVAPPDGPAPPAGR